MDFWNFFKGFLGLPKSNEVPNNFQDDRSAYLKDHGIIARAPAASEQEEAFGFNVFSNPLDMHRYFEKQMNDAFKAFGFQGEAGSFTGPGGNPFFDFHGFQDEHFNDDASGSSQVPDGNLRDRYLKPGYGHQQHDDSNKADSDIDGKVDLKDLDLFSNKSVQPAPRKGQSQFHLFGQSIASRTVRNADGSIETHRTVRDHEGNEETTTTRKYGDKEHTVITKTTKDGKKEITENFVNCDEGTDLLDKYFK